ncbi:MAG: diguanylate cyclase, partial [Acidobacteria bacterium]|nr:diguanylate cyclase [Acidobacteriota bacterium]
MGDVFTILALTQFGPGPALFMYWLDMIAGHLTDVVRHYGFQGITQIKAHKVFFNLACCSLSVFLMNLAYRAAIASNLQHPANFIMGLLAVAIIWFLVNTITLSVAISFWSNEAFWEVWREGISLALLNFMGSAAAAGLISLFYKKAGFWIFLLSLPIAVVVYQLYRFYIERYEQAEAHISELSKLYLQTVEALSSAVDAKDRYTHGHIRRVQAYATELAKCIGIHNQNQLLAIQAGALLHDIGKIAIPEYILNKPTLLTETEFEKMKIHPVVGATMLGAIDFPYPVVPIVRSHHERWDGNGYPDGLKGEQIPLTARILSLVDCYDALTTNRPYRAPMSRSSVIDFFKREAGRSYDPTVVQQFLDNLEQIEAAGKKIVGSTDVWGIKQIVPQQPASSPRQLERVQPTLTYGRALNAGPRIQRELYSVFEFARAGFQCLKPKEVFSFMGAKIENLVDFDAAAFYLANLEEGSVVAEHVVGTDGRDLRGLTLTLEQKLTGWVAANNQALCNLPPFPDFLKCVDPRPSFELSAIAPLHRHGEVLGAISLYRKGTTKFTEEEFRRLEIIASQTAILLAKCARTDDETPLLFDSMTGLPNVFQLHLAFDPIAVDASRYEYPLAVLSVSLDDIKGVRRKWGQLSGDEAVRTTATYIGSQLRETDFLVRYAGDEFVALNPKMTRDQAENLRSRLQNELDLFRFGVRADTTIPLRVSIGIAMYPEDST